MFEHFSNFKFQNLFSRTKTFFLEQPQFYTSFFLLNYFQRKSFLFVLVMLIVNFLAYFQFFSIKIFIAYFLVSSTFLLVTSKKGFFVFCYNIVFLSELVFWYLKATEAPLKFFISLFFIFFLRDFFYFLFVFFYYVFFSFFYNVFDLVFKKNSIYCFTAFYLLTLVIAFIFLVLYFFSYWVCWYYLFSPENSFVLSAPKFMFYFQLASVLFECWGII